MVSPCLKPLGPRQLTAGHECSFNTSQREPGILGEGFAGGVCESLRGLFESSRYPPSGGGRSPIATAYLSVFWGRFRAL